MRDALQMVGAPNRRLWLLTGVILALTMPVAQADDQPGHTDFFENDTPTKDVLFSQPAAQADDQLGHTDFFENDTPTKDVLFSQPAAQADDQPGHTDFFENDTPTKDVLSSQPAAQADDQPGHTGFREYDSPTTNVSSAQPAANADSAESANTATTADTDNTVSYIIPQSNARSVNWFAYHSPFRVRFMGGQTYAMRNSTTAFELLHPLTSWRSYQTADEGLSYFEGRVGVTKDGRFLGNFGLGARHYDADRNRIYDGNIWYDADDSSGALFHQFTVGGQVQSELLAARSHYYHPFDDTTQSLGYTPLTGGYRFGGRNILFDRDRIDAVAMPGFDVEFGLIFSRDDYELRTFAGYYRFASGDADNFDGYSLNVEADLLRSLTVGLLFTDDSTYDQNLMFTASWTFNNYRREPQPSIRHRLGDFSRRNYNVVLVKSQVYDPEVATDPSTGNPIQIVHAGTPTSGSGNGTVENPFASLSTASNAAASTETNLLFAHADSTFNGQGVALAQNQQFVGEGYDFMIPTAQMGNISLPRSNSGNLPPRILGSPAAAPAITLNNGVGVYGIDIENAGGVGILGDSLTGPVLVSQTRVDGADRGIVLSNSSGILVMDSVSVANTAGDGIDLNDNTGGAILFVGPTQIENSGGDGLQLTGGTSAVTFAGDVNIRSSGESAIDIETSSGQVNLLGITALENTNGSASSTLRINNSDGDVTIADLVIDDTFRAAAGAAAVGMSNNTNTVEFQNVNIVTNDGGGISGNNIGTFNVGAGTINATGGRGLDLDVIRGGNMTFDNISVTNADIGIRMRHNDLFFRGSLNVNNGVITGVQTGALIDNVENVTLSSLQIDSSVVGIDGADTENLLISNNLLTSTSNNWVGIDVHSNPGITTAFPVFLLNNAVTGSGDNQVGISISSNQTLPAGTVTVSGNTINLTGANTLGIDILANGNGLAAVNDGDITLSGAQNNVSNATQAFNFTEQNAAFLHGQIIINGTTFNP